MLGSSSVNVWCKLTAQFWVEMKSISIRMTVPAPGRIGEVIAGTSSVLC